MQIAYLKPPPSHAFEDSFWKETTGPHEPCQGPQTSDIIQVTRWALESWAFHYGLPVVKEHNIGGAHPTWVKFCDFRYQTYWSCPSYWRYLLLLKFIVGFCDRGPLTAREKPQDAKWPWCKVEGHMIRQLKWKTYAVNFRGRECVVGNTKAISHIQIINPLESPWVLVHVLFFSIS